jgi:activator of HSP90 ATPase
MMRVEVEEASITAMTMKAATTRTTSVAEAEATMKEEAEATTATAEAAEEETSNVEAEEEEATMLSERIMKEAVEPSSETGETSKKIPKRLP